METAPGQLVSARLVQYSAARTLPFSEVQDAVREKVIAAKANELAKKEGADKLAAWKAAHWCLKFRTTRSSVGPPCA